MMWHRVVLVLMAIASPCLAQQDEVALASPRFLQDSGVDAHPIDPALAPALQRRVTLTSREATLGAALRAIARQAGLELMYSKDVVPLAKPISVEAQNISVAAALTEVLLGTGLDVLVLPGWQLGLVKGPAMQEGTVTGQVTDAKTGKGIPGASVVLAGTRWRTTTDENGQYKIVDVAAGTYMLRASRIGYGVQTQSVTVVAGQGLTVDLALQVATTELEQIVVTGNIIPTERKAVPTPITVISDSEIASQRPHTVVELFREAVPSAVSWDVAAYPVQTSFSVRGASSLSSGTGQMKIFVDGFPVADLTGAAVDPNSIARIEVIRGPEAAAIYGSDAIGGVIQIFTKRGDATLTQPEVRGETSLGVVQTPYAGYNGVVRQIYSASVRGGGADVSYQFGGGYTHTGDWAQPVSAQSNPSVYGGLHVARGILTADVSARDYVEDNPQIFNPDIAATGFRFFSKPYYRLNEYRPHGVGARLSLSPTAWWQHTVTVGVDETGSDAHQTQPRLTTPSDTFLIVSNLDEAKTSIGYNTSVSGALGADVTGSLTTGVDHYSLRVSSWFTAGALNSTGAIQTNPSQPASASRTITNNTGYFAQAQVAFHDALFLTAGIRAEQNSDFGDSLGTPVSPQVGISYVRPISKMTLKLRGSWGRAIRPPAPTLKNASASPGTVVLANHQLAPERQQGWDAGVEGVFGARGSLSVTYFNQVARDLIQDVFLSATSSVSTFQNENVGRVTNTGVEVEAAALVGPLRLKGQYGYVRSRIEDLGPNYSGAMRVGDRPLAIPTHTAGVSLTAVPRSGTAVAGGLTYVGSFASYDLIALYSCFAGTGPCRAGPGLRNYIIDYPSFVKVNATFSQQLTRWASAFVSVDNLTNNTSHELTDFTPVMGRITTLGVQFHP